MHPRSSLVVSLSAVAVLAAGCSHSTSSAADAVSPNQPTAASAKQQYLDRVDHLCDKLLPQVLKATHGGSVDIPAQQYLRDWPAHRQVLMAFDRSLAAVPVPRAAAHASDAMAAYVRFADRLDAARLRAAHEGEAAWRHQVASEKNIEAAPAIAARDAAGFTSSCDAR